MNFGKMMKEIYMESNKDPKESRMDALWNKIIKFIGFDITVEERKCGVMYHPFGPDHKMVELKCIRQDIFRW